MGIYIWDKNSQSAQKVASKAVDASLEIYSTEEVIIGKWIDRKPIYRRVIISNATSRSSISLGQEIDTLINLMYVRTYEGVNDTKLIYSGGENTTAGWFYDSVGKTLNTVSGSGSSYIKRIVLEYTKTTD